MKSVKDIYGDDIQIKKETFFKHFISDKFNKVATFLYLFMNIIIFIKEPTSWLIILIITTIFMSIVLYKNYRELNKKK